MQGKKTTKKSQTGAKAEFSGRIGSISAGLHFQFGLLSKKEGRPKFNIESSDAGRFSAMVGLVTSAYFTGTKISVTSTTNTQGLLSATEIWIGEKQKLTKQKSPKLPSQVIIPAATSPDLTADAV